MSRSLITGASGFIGRRLLQPGDRALVRQPGTMSGAVAGDLLDPASLFAACAGVETVFHCAGYAHVFNSSDPDAHWCINFEGTRNLVEAAGQAGVKRFVFLSSVKAMVEPGDACVDEDWPGEPIPPYGQAKRAAEDVVGDVLGAAFRRPLLLNSEVVERLLGSAWYSPARIERELGWRAELDLATGLREMIDGAGQDRNAHA